MGNYIIYKTIFAPFSFAPWPLIIVIFFFSVVIHEVAHGVVAGRCGDDTARVMGRITLNPIAHIDIIGTIIVPVVLYMMGGFIIGWAKPVPINPLKFRNLKADTIKVGASGILANFSLAILFSLIIWVLNILNFHNSQQGFTFIAVLASGVAVNIVLGLFNLVPIPPLDGSRIVSSLLPDDLARKYDSIAPFGFIILVVTIRIIWPFILQIGNIFYKLLFIGLP